jgi:hypothetical protein
MITLNDVIGFSDLTETEVQTVARHEHVTPLEAVLYRFERLMSQSSRVIPTAFILVARCC